MSSWNAFNDFTIHLLSAWKVDKWNDDRSRKQTRVLKQLGYDEVSQEFKREIRQSWCFTFCLLRSMKLNSTKKFAESVYNNKRSSDEKWKENRLKFETNGLERLMNGNLCH